MGDVDGARVPALPQRGTVHAPTKVLPGVPQVAGGSSSLTDVLNLMYINWEMYLYIVLFSDFFFIF